jgi:hypothetical protein
MLPFRFALGPGCLRAPSSMPTSIDLNDLLREKREVAAQLSGLEPGASVVLVTPDRASTVPG